MKRRIITIGVFLLSLQISVQSQTTYYSTSTANTWSLSSGGSSCGCSPTAADYVVVSHNWANSSFYPLTHPANIAFGNFLSVNPKKVTVKNGGVVYQQPTLTTGTEIYVESGGFWAYNGSLIIDASTSNAAKIMQNAGTILVNGSYNNNIAINSNTGVFCKNGSWVNNALGSLNGISDANMDSYFNQTAYGCTNCCLSAGTLPVELTSFMVKRKDNSIIASWTTASEINNDYFELQISGDAESWKTITTVKGAGNSSVINEYSVEDTDLGGFEIKYYRLKQVDYDGTTAYSYIRSLQISPKDGDIQVYENDNDILVVLNYRNPIFQIVLLDINGKQLNQNIEGILYSKNTFSFSKNNFASGLYVVQVVSANQVLSKKIFVSNQ